MNMEKKFSLRQRCCSWLLSSRREEPQPVSASPNQVTALKKIMETEYPTSDPSADRRRYEMNMLRLFRFSVAKRYHKQVTRQMDEKTQGSLRRLLLFIHTIPDLRKRHHEYRQETDEVFLTDLAIYWKSLPNNEEMMKYKEIWEHVAQRPIAWECLPGMPSRTVTTDLNKEETLSDFATCMPPMAVDILTAATM